MAERRAKQATFAGKKAEALAAEAADEDVKATEERKLVIYTWGASLRKACPHKTGHNFNVCGVSYRKKATGVDLRKMTGMDEELKAKIATAPRFEAYITAIVKVVERDDLSVISINCRKGRHRSVAVANVLKDRYYPNAQVVHLELGRIY